jgi:hypothetical protein
MQTNDIDYTTLYILITFFAAPLLIWLLPIIYINMLVPLGNISLAFCKKTFHFFKKKNEIEKEIEAQELARKRIVLAEMKRETMRLEKQVMKIQESILDEEFEKLDDTKKSKS